MPIVSPAPDKRDEEPVKSGVSYSDFDRIQQFLSVPNWSCKSCNSVNFGHNKSCAYCYGRRGIHVPRLE
jgi:hypothetical protein